LEENFRGHKDLRANEFAVEEVVDKPDDMMGAPATEPVRKEHFEKLIGFTSCSIAADFQVTTFSRFSISSILS
jgi:hypothetical protein